jgi:hypothetical protein
MRTLTNRGRAGGEDAWACGHGPGAAYSINDAGQAVGLNPYEPVEWSGGEVIVLGGPLGGHPYGINNSGQAVGYIYGTPVRIPEPSTWVMMCSALPVWPLLVIAEQKQATQLFSCAGGGVSRRGFSGRGRPLRAQGKALRAIAAAAHQISHEGVAGILRVAGAHRINKEGLG